MADEATNAPNTSTEATNDNAGTENVDSNKTQEAQPQAGNNSILSEQQPASKENTPATPATPETYTYELPEGMEMSTEQKALFETNAREIGLSNEQAQIMLKLDAKRLADADEAHQKQVTRWADEVKMDKEMGGANFESTVAYAKAGLKKFDPDGKLFAILERSGYSNNPDVIRVMSNIGKSHAEDMVILGDSVTEEKPRHERLYGKYNNM